MYPAVPEIKRRPLLPPVAFEFDVECVFRISAAYPCAFVVVCVFRPSVVNGCRRRIRRSRPPLRVLFASLLTSDLISSNLTAACTLGAQRYGLEYFPLGINVVTIRLVSHFILYLYFRILCSDGGRCAPCSKCNKRYGVFRCTYAENRQRKLSKEKTKTIKTFLPRAVSVHRVYPCNVREPLHNNTIT